MQCYKVIILSRWTGKTHCNNDWIKRLRFTNSVMKECDLTPHSLFLVRQQKSALFLILDFSRLKGIVSWYHQRGLAKLITRASLFLRKRFARLVTHTFLIYQRYSRVNSVSYINTHKIVMDIDLKWTINYETRTHLHYLNVVAFYGATWECKKQYQDG